MARRVLLFFFLLTFLSGIVVAQTAPRLFFSDLDSGPKTGGENNQGVYVCVFGVNFGGTRGTSTISVGGVAASNYAYWGPSGTSGPAGEKACFQMGSTTPAGPATVTLTVGGVQSNALPFTVRTTGSIYCIDSVGGSDSNNGKFTTDAPPGGGCKATLTAGYALIKPGDTAYVKSGIYQTNGYGNAILYLNGSGTAGNPKALVGYPGSSSTIGFDQNDTYTYGIRGNGGLYGCDYHTIANLQTIHAGAAQDQTKGDAAGQAIAMNGCSHVRVVGNRLTNPFQNNQESAMGGSAQLTYPTVYEHAFNAYLGNEVFNTGTSVPARVTNYAGEPYTITATSNTMLIAVDGGTPETIVLNTCSGCTIASVVADLNSKLTGATAYNLSNALIKITSNNNLGASGSIVLSPVTNSAYTALAFGAGTYYGGAQKQTHSVYFGTNSHDIEAGWNHIHNNNGCRGFQMHSSPLYTQVGSADPTGITMYNMAIHDNYIHDTACDAINFASVDPSLGYVRAYNNVIWHVGTGLNQTREGGMSAVYVAHLANKMFQTANTGCTFSTSGALVTGSAQCHFTSELQPGWSICQGDFGTDTCVAYSATIASIVDDTHMTLVPIPAPYNRFFVITPQSCDSAGTCNNLGLYFRKTGIGSVEVYNNTIYDAGVSTWFFGQSTGAFCRDGGAAALMIKAVNNAVFQLASESYVQPNGCIAATSSVPTGYFYDTTSTNNILFSNGTPIGGIPFFTQHNIQSNPLFTNVAANDFSLQASSPAINNGVDTTNAVPRDIRGLTRPPNGVDIGAYEYTIDEIPPVVSISAPTAGGYSGTITLTASCTDNLAVSTMQFLVDDTAFGTVFNGAGSHTSSLNTDTLTSGAHTIGAICTDSNGNTGAAVPVPITVRAADSVPPVVVMTSPSGGTYSSTLTLSGNCTDNVAVQTFQFTVDGANFGTSFSGGGAQSISLNAGSLTGGTHQLGATCRDTSGNISTAVPINITVVQKSGGGSSNDFTFAIQTGTAATATIAAGATATFAFSLQQSAAGTNNITLSCSGLPSGATCSATPNPVALTTTGITPATIAISTQARPNASLANPGSKFWARATDRFHKLAFTAVLSFLPIGGFVFIGWSQRRRSVVIVVVVLLMLLMLVGCGGGAGGNTTSKSQSAPGTPAGTYKVTVTATAGTVTHTVDVTVTVN
jgi:hypothetical protein